MIDDTMVSRGGNNNPTQPHLPPLDPSSPGGWFPMTNYVAPNIAVNYSMSSPAPYRLHFVVNKRIVSEMFGMPNDNQAVLDIALVSLNPNLPLLYRETYTSQDLWGQLPVPMIRDTAGPNFQKTFYFIKLPEKTPIAMILHSVNHQLRKTGDMWLMWDKPAQPFGSNFGNLIFVPR